MNVKGKKAGCRSVVFHILVRRKQVPLLAGSMKNMQSAIGKKSVYVCSI